MLHVIEKASGRIIEQCPEGSDVSRFSPADFEVVSGAARIDDHGAYRYQAGEMVAKPVATLAADKLTIAADGQDQAVVSVTVAGADPLPASVDIEVGGLVESVGLTGGAGRLPPITAENAGDIQVRAYDQDAFYDQGGLIIRTED